MFSDVFLFGGLPFKNLWETQMTLALKVFISKVED